MGKLEIHHLTVHHAANQASGTRVISCIDFIGCCVSILVYSFQLRNAINMVAWYSMLQGW